MASILNLMLVYMPKIEWTTPLSYKRQEEQVMEKFYPHAEEHKQLTNYISDSLKICNCKWLSLQNKK